MWRTIIWTTGEWKWQSLTTTTRKITQTGMCWYSILVSSRIQLHLASTVRCSPLLGLQVVTALKILFNTWKSSRRKFVWKINIAKLHSFWFKPVNGKLLWAEISLDLKLRNHRFDVLHYLNDIVNLVWFPGLTWSWRVVKM